MQPSSTHSSGINYGGRSILCSLLTRLSETLFYPGKKCGIHHFMDILRYTDLRQKGGRDLILKELTPGPRQLYFTVAPSTGF